MNQKMLIGLLTLLGLLNVLKVVAAQKDVGYLKVDADPGRAGIFVDEKYVGPAANFRVDRKCVLAPGQHTILLSDPRYKDYSTTIKIEAGKTTKISHVMEKLPVPQPPYGMLCFIRRLLSQGASK